MRGIREVIKVKDSLQLEKYIDIDIDIDIDARGLLKGVPEIKLVKFSVNCT